MKAWLVPHSFLLLLSLGSLCYQKQLCVTFTFQAPVFPHVKTALWACPSAVLVMPVEIQDAVLRDEMLHASSLIQRLTCIV